MKYSIRRFSSLKQGKVEEERTFGKVWEGVKGGLKGAKNGAMIGAIAAPGNLLALATGHHKIGLGLTAAGALVGAGVGGRLGYKDGVSDWKYKNDPEFAKKKDAEDLKHYKEHLKYALNQDLSMAEDFSSKDWKKLAGELKKKNFVIPKEILNYIDFYERIWKKKIKDWYNSMPKTGKPWETVEFKEIFPMPYNSGVSKEWMGYDESPELYFLTVNDAGDDGWAVYNFETKEYGWDLASPGGETSFRNFILKSVDYEVKNNNLTEQQLKSVQEFKRNVNKL